MKLVYQQRPFYTTLGILLTMLFVYLFVILWLPNVLVIERSEHGEMRHAQEDRPTNEAYQDKQNPQETYLDNETGNTIYVGANGRTHVFLPSGEHHTSFRTTRQNRLARVAKGKWTKLLD